MITLALVPPGRVWGLNGVLLRRRGAPVGELQARPS